ncbi:MAG: rhodanese-like domain-containing protein [Clostridia bacterium]
MFHLKDLFGGGPSCKSIAPKEAKALLDASKSADAAAPKVVLVDVRSAQEYAQAHIPGSVLLPLDQVGVKAAQVLQDKAAAIIVYCLSGGRSSAACGLLLKMGYTNVMNLGGIGRWPYGTEAGSAK